MTNATYSQTATIKGKVTDESKIPITFVNLSIAELSVSTISNEKGNFTFQSVPYGSYHISASRNGFLNKTIFVTVDSTNFSIDILLEASLIETPTINVTGVFAPSDVTNSALSITSITGRVLSRIRNENIASTIQSIPGINNLSTGTAIGKPVIRGLTSQSVLIVHDGVKHESQMWGDEHSPEISLFNIDRIEILRGPASLIYGADGIGGVVNIVTKPLQFSNSGKPITYGSLDLNGFSMNTEGAANLSLGLGTRKFGVRGYGGYRHGGNTKTPEGTLEISTPEGSKTIEGGELSNSGTSEFHAGANLGLSESFGNISASYEIFQRQIQIHEDPTTDPGATPNQTIITNHFELKGNFPLKYSLQLESILSAEIQNRKEFESEENEQLDSPALNLELKMLDGNVRLHHSLTKDLSGTLGGSVILQGNETLAEEKLIPNYDAIGIGAYVMEKFEKKTYSANVGLRYDHKSLNIKETVFETAGTFRTVKPDELNFDAVTGSIGIVYKPVEGLEIYSNAGKGWRPPSEYELYVDGVHEGTGRFEKGLVTTDTNYAALSEESINIDAGLRVRNKYFNGELSFFRNFIDNFIYPSPTGIVDSASGLQIFNVFQDESVFTGYEYSLQFHPIDIVLLTLKGDYVFTKNEANDSPIPFTPPSKNIIELKLQEKEIGVFYNPYVNFSVKIVSDQNRVDPLESETPGYTLYDAGAGFDFILSKSIASVDLSVINIADEKYVDHLSRYRYYAMNPGRSFNLKLTVPFQF